MITWDDKTWGDNIIKLMITWGDFLDDFMG
jgi:hypothetical protein